MKSMGQKRHHHFSWISYYKLCGARFLAISQRSIANSRQKCDFNKIHNANANQLNFVDIPLLIPYNDDSVNISSFPFSSLHLEKRLCRCACWWQTYFHQNEKGFPFTESDGNETIENAIWKTYECVCLCIAFGIVRGKVGGGLSSSENDLYEELRNGTISTLSSWKNNSL